MSNDDEIKTLEEENESLESELESLQTEIDSLKEQQSYGVALNWGSIQTVPMSANPNWGSITTQSNPNNGVILNPNNGVIIGQKGTIYGSCIGIGPLGNP